jgi:hypothetical protein
MMTYKFSAVSVFIFSCITSLHAQPAVVQQLQSTRLSQQVQTPLAGLTAGTNAPELYSGENTDVGPQRILRLQPRWTWFDVLLDSQVFYTDNANYAQNPYVIGSSVFVNTAQVAFTPPALTLGPGKLAADGGFVSQWYNYGNTSMSAEDFDAQTVFMNGKYTLQKWQFGLGANYTRLLSQHNYEETYTEWLPNLSAQRVVPLNDVMLVALSDQVDYHFTRVPSIAGSPADINNRFDNNVMVTFSWQATHEFVIQPYYRFQYSLYEHNTALTGNRSDYLHTVGIVAIYTFNRYTTLRVFFNYNALQSDDPLTPAYHEDDGGVGGSLDFKF